MIELALGEAVPADGERRTAEQAFAERLDRCGVKVYRRQAANCAHVERAGVWTAEPQYEFFYPAWMDEVSGPEFRLWNVQDLDRFVGFLAHNQEKRQAFCTIQRLGGDIEAWLTELWEAGYWEKALK